MEPSHETIAAITDRLRQAAAVAEATTMRASEIARAAALITESFRQGGKLLLCGNGGSAADCQHLAAEFVSRLTKNTPRPPMPALALTTDTSYLTAYANDFGFEGVFARQLDAFGHAGDVLMAISTSGSSPNVLAAAATAKRRGMTVVALLGDGGPLGKQADVAIHVPSNDTQLIQQVHVVIEHVICELVERALYR